MDFYRRFLLSLILFSLGSSTARPAIQSPNDPLRIASLPAGVFQLIQGKTRRTVDLHRSISGCWGRLYDGSQGEQSGPGDGGSISTRVLDMVHHAGFWYVVLQVDTNSRCDIQGPCGAATNSDVLWLTLSANLKLAAQQTATVEACQPTTELISFSGRRPDEMLPPFLELANGKLTLTSQINANDGTPTIQLRLQYDRRTPEKGLGIRRS